MFLKGGLFFLWFMVVFVLNRCSFWNPIGVWIWFRRDLCLCSNLQVFFSYLCSGSFWIWVGLVVLFDLNQARFDLNLARVQTGGLVMVVSVSLVFFVSFYAWDAVWLICWFVFQNHEMAYVIVVLVISILQICKTTFDDANISKIFITKALHDLLELVMESLRQYSWWLVL